MTPSIAHAPLDELIANFRMPRVGDPLSPEEAKDLAVMVAYQGIGLVSPNPLVGAVIVSEDHRFISAGAHKKLGSSHAEINALNSLPKTQDLSSATMYVTLEPCSHQGKTPPCAPQVVDSGISKVVYGLQDPNPEVSGQGARYIESKGVTCTLDPTWQAAQQLAEIFLWNHRQKLPFVGMKCATSLDGKIGNAGAQRAWITGKRARAYGHFLRCYYDGIMVGASTLLADNPTLDTRDAILRNKSEVTPLKIIIDPDARALNSHPLKHWNVLAKEPEKVLWITKSGVNIPDLREARHVTIEQENRFSAQSILEVLKQNGISSVLLEGGHHIYQTFADAQAIQKIHWFQASKILGNVGTLPALSNLTQKFRPQKLSLLDHDWLVDLMCHPGEGES